MATEKGENSVETAHDRQKAGLQPPYSPGTSGNPKGRPKGAKTGLRARMMQMLDKMPDTEALDLLKDMGVDTKVADNAEAIAAVVALKARAGDMQAVKILAEQTELPHPKDVKLTGDFHIVIPGADADTL